MSMINGTRLYDHLTRLGRIGFVPKEGTTRLPYTPAYDEGRIYVQQCMEQAGLQTSVDPVGNLIGTLPGQGEIICIGSHIDTVPGGGIYDGTYGVLSGIECVQRLKELGYQNRHPIQVIAFTEEEGNVIGGTFGSKAFTGGEIDEAMRPNLALHGLTMEQVGAPSGLVRQSELKCQKPGCAVLREVLLLFLALSLPAFAHEVYVQRLLCGVAWSGVACVRGAVRLLSHQQLRQLRVFSLAVQHAVPEHALSLLQAACEHALHVARPAHRMGCRQDRHALRRV